MLKDILQVKRVWYKPYLQGNRVWVCLCGELPPPPILQYPLIPPPTQTSPGSPHPPSPAQSGLVSAWVWPGLLGRKDCRANGQCWKITCTLGSRSSWVLVSWGHGGGDYFHSVNSPNPGPACWIVPEHLRGVTGLVSRDFLPPWAGQLALFQESASKHGDFQRGHSISRGGDSGASGISLGSALLHRQPQTLWFTSLVILGLWARTSTEEGYLLALPHLLHLPHLPYFFWHHLTMAFSSESIFWAAFALTAPFCSPLTTILTMTVCLPWPPGYWNCSLSGCPKPPYWLFILFIELWSPLPQLTHLL